MLLVRETFIAKPGHAGELAKMMKGEMSEADASGNMPLVLLDQVAEYNTIIVEYQVKSLADFEETMTKEKTKMKSATPKPGPKYTDLYLTGRREIFRIVE